MKFLYTKNDIFKERYFIYNYNDDNFRLVKLNNCKMSGFEEINKKSIIDYNSEEVQRISLSRTKRNIREIALCNPFTHFVTITINSSNCDRYSLQNCQDLLKKTLKKIKRKNKDFIYLFITEKHKDGAFHFHGLTSTFDDLYINENGYYCSYILSNEIGYNSFSPIKDFTRCCNYICKYITKDCIKNSHNQIYISSRGLKKATREEINKINFNPSYKNDYCSILDFKLSDLDNLELLNLIYNIKEGKNKTL